MAYFARMNSSNEVKQVYSISNSDIIDPDTGDESETVGIVRVKLANPGACAAGGYWKQCSYNTINGVHLNSDTPLRGNFPSVGWFYDSSKDVFHTPRPNDMNGILCSSWEVNSTTGLWEAPLEKPNLTEEQNQAKYNYEWDEAAYQADNTTGWVLVTPI